MALSQTLDDLARAAAEAAAARGASHVEVVRLRLALGAALVQADRLEAAETAYALALAGREEALGPDHPEHAVTLTELSRLAARRGDDGRARDLARRATSVLEGRVPADLPLLRTARALALTRER